MQITIRNLGNSKGVVLPKTLLTQAGLHDQATAELSFENGAIVLRRPITVVREGWAQAAAQIAARGEDALVLGDFGNEADADWKW